MARLTSTLVLSLIDRVTGPARAVSAAVERLRAASARNARQMAVMRGRVFDAAAAGYAVARAFTAPVRAAMAFEGAMADINKVVDFKAPDGLQKMSKDILKMSTAIPMTASGIAEIVAAAGQAGMKGDELLAFAEMAAKVGVAFDMAAGTVGESLAKIKTALGLSVAETRALGDAINHLSNTSASSAPDLLNFMRRVGAEGAKFGLAREQVLALGSAMIAAGSGPDVAATSFRNMGKALVRGASATKRQVRAFRKLGLSATDVAKRMQKDAVGTIRDVIKRIKALPREVQASTISDLFGDEARALSPLLERMEILEHALREVGDESRYAGSAQEEYAVRAETAANKVQLFRNRLEKLSITIGKALLPAIVRATEALTPLIAAATDFAQANPRIVANAAMAVAALVALRVAAIAARFAFAFLKGGVIDAALVLARGAAGLLGLLNPLKLVRNAFLALRVAFMSTGIGAVLVGFAAAGTWIWNNWSGLKEMFAGIGEVLRPAFAGLEPVFGPVIDAGKRLIDIFSSLTGKADMTGKEWRELGRTAGRWIADIPARMKAAFDEIPDRLARTAQRLGTAMSEIVRTAGRWIADIPARVKAAFDEIPDRLAHTAQRLGTAMGDLGRTLMDALLEGLKAGAKAVLDHVANIGSRIGSGMAAAARSALSKMKGLVGLGEAPAVAGARAAGGPIVAGRTYLVGERGPELVTPKRSGYVHDAGETERAMSAPTGRTAPVAATEVNISFGDIVIQGAHDAGRIAAELESRIRESLAGIQADTEFAVS